MLQILERPPAWEPLATSPTAWTLRAHAISGSCTARALPSSEGWPVTWLFSTLLKLKQEQRRRERMMRATQELDDLKARLEGRKPRLRTKAEIAAKAEAILSAHHVTRFITLRLERYERPAYRQTKPGRPGPKTTYKRVDKRK